MRRPKKDGRELDAPCKTLKELKEHAKKKEFDIGV